MGNFPEKMIKGIDKGFKTVGSKSKEFVSTAKIRNEIKHIESEIRTKYEHLGRKAYGMAINSAVKEEELAEDCKDISSLYRKITELEEQIEKIEEDALKRIQGEGTILCAECKAPNKASGKFCKNCGTSLKAEVQTAKMRCSECNSMLEEGKKFCLRCGKKR